MKKHITFTFLNWIGLAFLFLSCADKPVKREVIDLENFPMDFKVDPFYATMKSSSKDTLFENQTDWRFSGTPIAFHNLMPRFTADTLAYFGKVSFESIEMIESLKGEFISLYAFNQSDGLNNFQKLLTYIESKNGKPKVTEGYSFRQFFTYSWDLKDRELIVLVSGEKQEYISTLLGIKAASDSSHIVSAKPPVINTTIFVFNKKFNKKFTITKVKTGDFLHLDSKSFSSMYLEKKP